MSSYNITTRKKDKGWQVIVSYKTLSGAWKQKSKQGFATSRQAKDYGQVIIDSLDGQIYIESHELRDITLEELFTMYMRRNKAGLSPNTIIIYKNTFRHILPLHSHKVVEITAFRVLELLDSFESFSRKREVRKLLAALFRYAVTMQLLPISPINGIPTYNNYKNNQRIRTISDREKERLLDYFESKEDTYSAVLTHVLANTGMRIGEALGLTWEDLNQESQTIRINKQWARIDEKGTLGFAKTKTINSNRALYIPNHTLQQLLRLDATTNRIFDVFANPQHYSNRLKKVLPNNSPHDFRHTYATKLLAHGVDMKTVSKLLGDDINTIIKTYLHYTDEMESMARQSIDSIFLD